MSFIRRWIKSILLPWWIVVLPLRKGFHPYFGLPTLPYGGPDLKLRKLKKAFGNAWWPSVIYTVSGKPLPLWFLHLARKKRIPVIVNQDGVYYPAWYAGSVEAMNRSLAALHSNADFVIFQSRFCEESFRQWVKTPERPSTILNNGVDVQRFFPRKPALERSPLRLLACSYFNMSNVYVLKELFEVIRHVANLGVEAELLIAGKIDGIAPQWPKRVRYLGAYSQEDAPALYRQAHIFLHLKYMDPCPSTVLEAMASGLPVICGRSGGTPELVGEEGGMVIDVPQDYQRLHFPSAEKVAEKINALSSQWESFALAARQRAVVQFSLEQWLARHQDMLQNVQIKSA